MKIVISLIATSLTYMQKERECQKDKFVKYLKLKVLH